MKIERLKSAHKNKSPIACFFKSLLILIILSLSIGVTHGFAKDKKISGYVRTASGNEISGVTITFSNGEGFTTTDSSGYYSQKVEEGWSGTATPSKVGYNFDPPLRNYLNVKRDQSAQDYTGTQIQQPKTISGYARTSTGSGIDGATITFSNGGGTDTTNSSGYYNHEVAYGWSGTATPSKDGYSFEPAFRNYNNVNTDQLNQDYVGIEENEQLSITMNIIGSGNIELDPDKDFYSVGSSITLTGTADSGWVFSEWSGDLKSSDNPESISISSDMIITAIFSEDFDSDGISDKEENSGPNGGDGNNDSILDSLQSNVSFLVLENEMDYVAIETPPGTSINNCKAVIDPPNNNYPSDVEFLYGFFTFTIEGINIGGSTLVIFYFPSGFSFNTYSKYGPTPDNTFEHWYEFIFDGMTGAEINENSITLHFVDGKRGDDDLTENGIIIDIGGPGIKTVIPSENDSNPFDGGHDSYGCFVKCLL
jgi:hypothetical protein